MEVIEGVNSFIPVSEQTAVVWAKTIFLKTYQNLLFVNAEESIMLTIISLNVPFTDAIVLQCLLACHNVTT